MPVDVLEKRAEFFVGCLFDVETATVRYSWKQELRVELEVHHQLGQITIKSLPLIEEW